MYVVYKPIVVNQGEQQTTQVNNQMIQYQPVQISGSQMNVIQQSSNSVNQPVQIIQGLQGQQFIQTQQVIQGQKVIQGQSLGQGQFQPVIQNQQLLQAQMMPIGQQFVQVNPMISGGQNLLPNQMNPVDQTLPIQLSTSQTKNMSTQQKDVKVKKLDLDKRYKDVFHISEPGDQMIKPEIEDPEYGQSNNMDQVQKHLSSLPVIPLTTNEDMGRIYPTGLVANRKSPNNSDLNVKISSPNVFDCGFKIKQEPKDTDDCHDNDLDKQSDVLKNEKGRTLCSSNRDKSEKVGRTLCSANHDKSEKVDICARNIWNNWAQDKYLTDFNCSYPVYDDLCTQIKDKDHFVELLEKFIYEVRDTDGQPFCWKTMQKIVKGLQDSLKDTCKWKNDADLMKTARIALQTRNIVLYGNDIEKGGHPVKCFKPIQPRRKNPEEKCQGEQDKIEEPAANISNNDNQKLNTGDKSIKNQSDDIDISPCVQEESQSIAKKHACITQSLQSISGSASQTLIPNFALSTLQNQMVPVVSNQHLPIIQNQTVPMVHSGSLAASYLVPVYPTGSISTETNVSTGNAFLNTSSTSNQIISTSSSCETLNYGNSSNCNKLLKRGHDKTEVDDSPVVKKIKQEPIEISDEETTVRSKNDEISNIKSIFIQPTSDNLPLSTDHQCIGTEIAKRRPKPRFRFMDTEDINSTIEEMEKRVSEPSVTPEKDQSNKTDPEAVHINLDVPDNTLKNNNWATNTWNDWAKARNRMQINGPRVPLLHDLHKNVTEPELNELLKKFVFEARNNVGEPYPPTSLKSLVSGFQRILRNTGWANLSLLDSSQKPFKEFHEAMEARCNELLKQGIGVMKKQAQIITEQQEQSLWEKEVLSLETGWGLIFAVYFYTCKVFCVGSAYELWKLKRSQFKFGEDYVGKFVEFKSRFNAISRKNKPIKQYKCGTNPRTYYCIVEKYVSLIPQLDDIFFFRPDERYPLKFTKTALGKNSLDSFVSKMMKRAGYKGYYTNHSIKATMAAKMFKQGYQEEFIQERTGHVSMAVKKYNKGIQNAEAVRANISSTLDPPAPKKVKKSYLLIYENEEEVMTEETLNKVVQQQTVQTHQKQNEYVQELENQTKSYEDVQASSQISQQEIEILQREKDKQNKEILILKKTVDEMELRIETQKQTLCARDESMRKLLEMLQSKGLSVQKIEDNQQEVEHLQTRQLEDDRKIKQLQNTLSQKESDIAKLKEENSKFSDELDRSKLQLRQQPSSTHTMQAMLEAKDSRISALEKEVQSVEDKIMTLQEEGSVHFDRKDKDSISSREKTLKAELDLLKKETSRKDKEILGLQMKKETLESQQTEHQQYIQVLKEQISAKDQQVNMIQGDVEDLRDRVKDKDSTIDRKSKKSHSLQSEKRKIETEVAELKEQIEIKDRRISNLQTQIESIESILQEKETQLKEARVKIESKDSDNKILSLEESLVEKERQIEKLKEQKVKSEEEHQEEIDVYSKASQDLKTRLDTLQLELNEKQTELVDLREQSTEAQSVKFQADSKTRQLESSLSEKTAEVEKLNIQIEELKSAAPNGKNTETLHKDISDLTSQVEQARNEANKAQAEVDRLLAIMKESENEKNEKENQIKEQQELIKEYRQKVGTLKRKQSMEKKNSATMLEEARKREDSLYDDATELEDKMKSKNDRIEELEEALKESVKITAEREMVMVDLQAQLEEAEKKVDEYTMDLVKLKSENSGKVDKMNKILEDKEVKLKKLHAERHKHLEEVFEMKQEAILAAMSEKDANIALLEMTSSKKQKNTEEIEKLNKEKEKLQQQLSDVTHNRMKLIQKQERREEKKKSSLPRRKRESTPDKSENPTETEQPPPPPVVPLDS